MTQELKYNFGDIVYYVTDDEQLKSIVTGMTLRPCGLVIYLISNNGTEKAAYDYEITSNKKTFT